MSFLTNYVQKYRLDALPASVKTRLQSVEDLLKKNLEDVSGQAPETVFDTCLKQHADKMNGLVETISSKISTLNLKGWKDYLGLFRFIWTISVEVYQVVEEMAGCAIQKDLSPEDAEKAKVEFGSNLVYFLWLTINPLKNRFNWIPFKASVEKKLVLWVSRKALDSVYDLFNASKNDLKTLSANSYIKAI